MANMRWLSIPPAGTPEGDRLRARFWAKVSKTDTCWMWMAGRDDAGYGQFAIERRPHGAHRVSWVLEHGRLPILGPGGKILVMHTCDMPPCVRPDHLVLGTPKRNAADAAAKGRVPGGRVLGPEVEEGIVTMRAAGATYAEICRVHGVALSTVHRRLGPQSKTAAGEERRVRRAERAARQEESHLFMGF